MGGTTQLEGGGSNGCDDDDNDKKPPAKEKGAGDNDNNKDNESSASSSSSLPSKKRKREGKAAKSNHQKRWEEMYHRLVEYHRLNGNANVPNRYPEDPQLGSWGKPLSLASCLFSHSRLMATLVAAGGAA